MDRNTLRSALLTRRQKFNSIFKEYEIEDNGEKKTISVEIRTPTVSARNAIMKAGQIKVGVGGASGDLDFSKMNFEAVLQCCFVPNTDLQVFERADEDAMMNMPVGGMFDELAKLSIEQMKGTETEAPKASGPTQSDK